jgi:dolichol-phosphate mannosyltransferase
MMSKNDLSSNMDLPEPASKPLLVLICTYNERRNLPELIPRIFLAAPDAHILVVDDGSPDGTGQWVTEQCAIDSRIHCILRSGKLGLGTAIREGMRYAIAGQYAWLVNLDGDLSHDPSVIPAMIRMQSHCDLAIGSRYIEGGGMEGCSWKRIFVSRSANVLARMIVGWKIQDCSSAFRMYRVQTIRDIPLDRIYAKGYGFLEEVLAMILRAGGRVLETPITYTERREGQSKLSIREAISTLAALIRVGRIYRTTSDAPKATSSLKH